MVMVMMPTTMVLITITMALLILINEQKHICLVVSHISSRKGVGLRIKKGFRIKEKDYR